MFLRRAAAQKPTGRRYRACTHYEAPRKRRTSRSQPKRPQGIVIPTENGPMTPDQLRKKIPGAKSFWELSGLDEQPFGLLRLWVQLELCPGTEKKDSETPQVTPKDPAKEVDPSDRRKYKDGSFRPYQDWN